MLFGSAINFIKYFLAGKESASPEIQGFPPESFHPETIKYFQHFPKKSLNLGYYTLLSSKSAIEHNKEYVPSLHVIKHGFYTIASTYSGEAVAIHLTSGAVFELSHEIHSEKGIFKGFNLSKPDSELHAQYSSENIKKYALVSYNSPKVFMRHAIFNHHKC